MFYAVRTQQATNALTTRQLLQFYSKKDREAYIEARGGVEIIRAKEAHKFSFHAPSYAVRCPDVGIIFCVYTIY